MRTKQLRPADLKELTAPGRYSDGGNLYFVIGSKGERRWAFMYKSRKERYPNGAPKVHELGLGGAPHGNKPAVSLADARRKADKLRKLIEEGTDPKAARKSAASAPIITVAPVPATMPTIKGRPIIGPDGEKNIDFGTYADAFLESKTKEFKNAVHVKQWARSLKVQAKPLRIKRVRDIETDDVLAILRPIWTATPESAKRLQERIEKVLDAATVEKYREGTNPARWSGHLKLAGLPARKQMDIANHKAIPFGEMPSFIRELRQRTSISARALHWTICTAARTNETIGARWTEINIEQKLWVVPASRMKKNREHRVPLSDRLIAILQELKPITGSRDFVFANIDNGKPLSNMAMLELLRGMRSDGATVHGMRSSFSDWANETTHHHSKIIDFCLAHINGDKAEAAYRRGDALEKRRAVLKDWDAYLAG